jgi:hypothetical protein
MNAQQAFLPSSMAAPGSAHAHAHGYIGRWLVELVVNILQGNDCLRIQNFKVWDSESPWGVSPSVWNNLWPATALNSSKQAVFHSRHGLLDKRPPADQTAQMWVTRMLCKPVTSPLTWKRPFPPPPHQTRSILPNLLHGSPGIQNRSPSPSPSPSPSHLRPLEESVVTDSIVS